MELVVEYCLHKLGGFFYKTYYLNGEAMALSFAISIGLVLTVFAVELTYVGFGNSGFRRVFFERSKSTITDIVYFVLQATGMITLFAALASFGLSYAITRAAQDAPHLDLAGRLPSWAHVLLFLVLSDFLSYWQHRLMHRLPVLWRLHEFHHAADEFNALTSSREHPLEKAINMAIMVVPALLIGLPTAEFAFVTITFGAIGLVKHSAIPWHGWFGKYVIQSPRDHFIHHSRVREHHDKSPTISRSGIICSAPITRAMQTVQSSVSTATTSTEPIRSAKASPRKSVSSNARGKLPRPSAA